MEIIRGFLEPFITVGSEGIMIEGVRRMISWEAERIELATRIKKITLVGKGLKMEYKSLDAILIRGQIDRIELGGVR